jgi:hypothetical protein
MKESVFVELLMLSFEVGFSVVVVTYFLYNMWTFFFFL